MTDPKAAEQKALDLLDKVIAKALKAGADAADAVAFESMSLTASCRLGEPEDVERSEGNDLGLRLFVGQRQAFVSTTDTHEDALDALVERAYSMAKLAPEDPYCGLADPTRLAKSVADLDLRDDNEQSADALLATALAAEDAGRAVPGVTNSEGGQASWGQSTVALATSGGYAGAYGATSHGIACAVVAEGENGMERDYDHSSARHIADLTDAETIGRGAGERTVKRLDPRKVASCTVPVVYDPRASGGLIGHLAAAVNGVSVARGTSFLKDAMGDQIFAPGITITDDPLRQRGLRSKPVDGEGVATARLDLIADGILQSWLLDSAAAKQLGLATTGHASRGTASPPSPSTTNLYMAAGTVDPETLIEDIESGFYVTELIGMGVNMVSGDYSRGAAGFWIENGEIAYPVSELTVAGNLRDMFAAIVPADDLVFRYGTNAPTLRIDTMTVAGS